MKRRVYFIAILMWGVWFLNACGGDDKESFDKLSPTEAAAAANDLNNQNAMDQALESMDDAFDLATPTLAASALMSEKSTMKKGDGGFQYNSSTGWWTWSYNYTYSWMRGQVNYQYRYTPRADNGHATAETDKLEYKYDYNIDADTTFSYGGYTMKYDMVWKMMSDMVVTGMVGYRTGSGNLKLNGNHEYKYDYRVISQQTVKMFYQLKFKYNDVQLARNNSYPVSGTINFTVKRTFDPSSPQIPNYFIQGTITFNGTYLADINIGGQNYKLNLNNGNIIVS